MRRTLSLPLLLLAGIAILHLPPSLGPWGAGDVEVIALRAHFDSVDRELRARDVSHLSAAQLQNRERLIATLRTYRDRGAFPHNHDFADRREPYFVDRHGTRCAMAYLIDASGRRDIVDHIARTRNNARIRELAGDATLVAWLDSAGLSVEEAGRIQPTYGGRTQERFWDDYRGVTTANALLQGIAIGLNVAVRPSARGRGARATLGLVGGALGIALGAAGDASSEKGALVAFNLVTGATSLGLGDARGRLGVRLTF